jgi:hypothetical protein
MTDYNPIAVDKAIEASNRSGHKIDKREAKQIHRLLAGRGSFKAEVQTYSCAPDAWTSNLLRFDTEANAEAYARDLAARWTAVKAWRVVPCTDPATDSWQGGRRCSVEQS